MRRLPTELNLRFVGRKLHWWENHPVLGWLAFTVGPVAVGFIVYLLSEVEWWL